MKTGNCLKCLIVEPTYNPYDICRDCIRDKRGLQETFVYDGLGKPLSNDYLKIKNT